MNPCQELLVVCCRLNRLPGNVLPETGSGGSCCHQTGEERNCSPGSVPSSRASLARCLCMWNAGQAEVTHCKERARERERGEKTNCASHQTPAPVPDSVRTAQLISTRLTNVAFVTSRSSEAFGRLQVAVMVARAVPLGERDVVI